MRKTKPKTYKGKLTKRQKEKEKQKVALAFILTIITVFGSFLMTEASRISTESHTVRVEKNIQQERGQLPKTEKKNLTMEQRIRRIAGEHDFRWPGYLVRLARCESKMDPTATNSNGKYGTDRGLFQINNKYHPEVSDECAFSVRCATKWTMEMINNGEQHQWACNELVLNQ